MEHTELEQLKEEVELMKAKLESKPSFDYSKTSNIVAAIALLFSFGTTVVAAYNSYQLDIRENRREARGLIQRLSKLPIENYELIQKYKFSGEGQALAGMLNQENILLAVQASELIERYPSSFNSTEYFSVAIALSSSNITEKVPTFFKRAIENAKTGNDFIVSTRAYASYLFSKGEIEEGNVYYEKALNAWETFPENNDFFKYSMDAQTAMYWAHAHLNLVNIPEAEDKIKIAEKHLEQLATSTMTDSLKLQLEELSSRLLTVQDEGK